MGKICLAGPVVPPAACEAGADAIGPGLQQYFFAEIARLDATVLIHAEDDEIVSANEQALKEAGRKDYMTHYDARSELAETLAIRQALLMAERTGARVVFAHVSTPENLSIIREARARGVKAFAETCPQYFYPSTDTLREKGPWVKFAPPVKPPGTQERMWEAMAQGLVDIISSDHCPFEKENKEKGLDDMWAAPPGIPGVETSLRLMLTGVAQGRISLGTLVSCMSKNPARLYGLYPRKGCIWVGSDADLVRVDAVRWRDSPGDPADNDSERRGARAGPRGDRKARFRQVRRARRPVGRPRVARGTHGPRARGPRCAALRRARFTARPLSPLSQRERPRAWLAAP